MVNSLGWIVAAILLRSIGDIFSYRLSIIGDRFYWCDVAQRLDVAAAVYPQAQSLKFLSERLATYATAVGVGLCLPLDGSLHWHSAAVRWHRLHWHSLGFDNPENLKPKA